MKASTNPTPKLTAAAAMSPGRSGTWAIGRASARATAMAKAPRPTLGMTLARIGDATANAATRITARRMPTSHVASTVIGIGLHARDHAPELLHVARELVDHPGPAEDEDESDPDQLRDERQGHLLDLGDGLQHRHHEPDD